MISVQVRTESGEILGRAQRRSVGRFFQADARTYPVLVHILPWTDTAFNESQIGVLLEEIGRYEGDAQENPEGESFGWLRELCEQVIAAPHRMLWFVGD
jgi:hypothetical protein